VRDVDELLRERLPVPGPWLSTQLRLASVVCPLVAKDGADHVLLVARPAGQTQHPGQLGFPGGMRHGDEDPIACALRECHEEIGVPKTALTVLGILPPRESSSGILVHCIVGRMQPVELRPDPREVDRVLHVPLAELCDANRWTERAPPLGAGGTQPRTSPHFPFTSSAGDELLWGLTARFVRDLVARLAPLLVLCAVALGQELPTLWRLGPLPKEPVSVSIGADGAVRGDELLAKDRTVLLRADRNAPWSAVHAVLVRARAVPLEVVLFAARLPDGRDGAYTLALPESFDAPAELHVSMHREREGVPATSLQLPLERFRRGFGVDSPVALGVSAVGDAPFGQVLEALATAADAGFTRAVPWCVVGHATTRSVDSVRLAIDVGPVPAFAVPAIESRVSPTGVFDEPRGNLSRAATAPRTSAISCRDFVSPPPEPQFDHPGLIVVRVVDNWFGRQQLADGGWPDATNRAALFETALAALVWGCWAKETDNHDHSQEARLGLATMNARALGWLVERQGHDGGFVGAELDVRGAAIAAYGLAEASAVCTPTLRGPAQDALAWLAKVRRADGGWSATTAGTSSDAITTAWCALAFEAGEFREFRAALRPTEIAPWFAAVQNDDGSYRLHPGDPNQQHDGATAAALMARCLPSDCDFEALKPLATKLAHEVSFDDPMTTFFMSYATLAIGPEPHGVWSKRARVLLTSMRKDEKLRTSWEPLAGLSPVATTALHEVSLYNYFRYRTLVR